LKKTIYILSISVLLLWTFIAFIGFINKRVPPTQKMKSATVLSANEIALSSNTDLKEYDDFIEKAINITGKIKDIKNENNHHTLILNTENEKTSILCKMQDDQIENINTLQIGETVTIKGIYKGYLIDMILLNCIIL